MHMIGNNHYGSKITTTTNASTTPQLPMLTREEYRTALDQWITDPNCDQTESEARSEATTEAMAAFDQEKARWLNTPESINLVLNYPELTTCPPLFEGLQRLAISSTKIAKLPENLPSSIEQVVMNQGRQYVRNI